MRKITPHHTSTLNSSLVMVLREMVAGVGFWVEGFVFRVQDLRGQSGN